MELFAPPRPPRIDEGPRQNNFSPPAKLDSPASRVRGFFNCCRHRPVVQMNRMPPRLLGGCHSTPMTQWTAETANPRSACLITNDFSCRRIQSIKHRLTICICPCTSYIRFCSRIISTTGGTSGGTRGIAHMIPAISSDTNASAGCKCGHIPVG